MTWEQSCKDLGPSEATRAPLPTSRLTTEVLRYTSPFLPQSTTEEEEWEGPVDWLAFPSSESPDVISHAFLCKDV